MTIKKINISGYYQFTQSTDEQATSEVSINQLPNGLLSLIFSFLGETTLNSQNLSRVCKQWNAKIIEQREARLKHSDINFLHSFESEFNYDTKILYTSSQELVLAHKNKIKWYNYQQINSKWQFQREINYSVQEFLDEEYFGMDPSLLPMAHFKNQVAIANPTDQCFNLYEGCQERKIAFPNFLNDLLSFSMTLFGFSSHYLACLFSESKGARNTHLCLYNFKSESWTNEPIKGIFNEIQIEGNLLILIQKSIDNSYFEVHDLSKRSFLCSIICSGDCQIHNGKLWNLMNRHTIQTISLKSGEREEEWKVEKSIELWQAKTDLLALVPDFSKEVQLWYWPTKSQVALIPLDFRPRFMNLNILPSGEYSCSFEWQRKIVTYLK